MATNDKEDQPTKDGLDALDQDSDLNSGRRKTRSWRRKLDRGEADSYHERMTAEREMRRMSSLWYRLFPIDYDTLPLAEYEQMPDGAPEGVDESLLVPSIAEEAIAAGLGLADKGEEEPPPVAETHSDTSNRNTVMFGSNALTTLLSKGGHGARRPSEIPDEPDAMSDDERLPDTLDALYDEAHGLLDAIPDDAKPEVEPVAKAEEKPIEAPDDDEQSDEAAREWAEIETEIEDAKSRVASGLDAIDALSEAKPQHAPSESGKPAEPVEEELDEEALQALEAEIVAKVAAAKTEEARAVGESSSKAGLGSEPTDSESESEAASPVDSGKAVESTDDAEPPAENAGTTGRLHALLGMLPFAAIDYRNERRQQELADARTVQPTEADVGGETSPMPVDGDNGATQPFDGNSDNGATQPIDKAYAEDATQPLEGTPDDETQPFHEISGRPETPASGSGGVVPQSSGRIGFLEAAIPADGNFAMPLADGTVKAKVKVMPVQGILLGGHARQARSKGSSSVRLRVRASKVNLQSISLIGPGQGYVPVDSPVGTNCKERIEPKIPKMRRIGEPASGME